MRKLLWPLLLLALVCGVSGIALAGTDQAPVPADVSLDDLLAPPAESCDAPAVEPEPQIADLGAELLQPMMMGQPCNETVCTPQEFCCNFSCSICAPRGGACIQIICD